MLFFRFNLKDFKSRRNRDVPWRIIDIMVFYFRKISEELSISDCLGFPRYSDLVGIPTEDDYIVFHVDEDVLSTSASARALAAMLICSEYSRLPIAELGGKSLYDIGITVEFCKSIPNHELSAALTDWAKEKNFKPLNEEVLWKNMTDLEKAGKFSTYLAEIESNGRELVVVDPYLFSVNPRERDQYRDFLSAVFHASGASRIVAVTDNRHFDSQLFQSIASSTSIPIETRFSSDFHDRFWIADRSKGFCTGTSLNGIGKRISIINFLSHEDVYDIVEELIRQSLI